VLSSVLIFLLVTTGRVRSWRGKRDAVGVSTYRLDRERYRRTTHTISSRRNSIHFELLDHSGPITALDDRTRSRYERLFPPGKPKWFHSVSPMEPRVEAYFPTRTLLERQGFRFYDSTGQEKSFESRLAYVTVPYWLPIVVSSVAPGLMLLSFARRLHRRRRETARIRAGRCSKCDYDLRGLDGSMCPECGSPSESVKAGHRGERSRNEL
jgi:hypothetical protein